MIKKETGGTDKSKEESTSFLSIGQPKKSLERQWEKSVTYNGLYASLWIGVSLKREFT